MRHIIHEIAQEGSSKEPARLRELLRATTACRASVMAGDVLTIEEMQILLERLEQVEHAGYCPHGRPVSVRLDADALARLFHRK
jgi:DNA mismatch repair protein MutL